ncbi:MAG: hypothetical protein GEV11_15680 [Streptosporangiales bacterium]|nr:hypothetical protein [Streptosporangiales bacterium]
MALSATTGYLLVCAASPFGTCRRCGGTGRKSAFVMCRRCHGTGGRLRSGRRVVNALLDTRDRFTR